MKTTAMLFIVLGLFSCRGGFDFLGSLWNPGDEYRSEDYERLVKRDGEDFRILQFTDTHVNAYYDDFDTLEKTFRMMSDAIHAQRPDLMVLTGDNVGNFFNSHWAWQLIEFLDSFAIPYALVMGNHDGDFMKLEDDNQQHIVAEIFSRGSYSLFEMGPDNLTGTGNYGLHIVNGRGAIIYALILLDSNSDYLRRDQVAWYEWYVRGVAEAAYPAGGAEKVKSLLFFHIPLPEIADIKREMEQNDLCDEDGRSAAAAFGESPPQQPVNTGLFEAVEKLGSTTHLFFGHDHLNTLNYNYRGVYFVYGLKTGYCAYHDPERLGATLIILKGEDSVTDVSVEHCYLR
jgi:3',5'-cyclic AMP phosphodiesterase CpdA